MKVKVKSLSRVRPFATPWTVAYQAPPSMGFSRQECWSGLPFPSPGDLPDPGIEPRSPALQADTLPSEPPGMGGKQKDFLSLQFLKNNQPKLILMPNRHILGYQILLPNIINPFIYLNIIAIY